jgi:hypothetical protein
MHAMQHRLIVMMLMLLPTASMFGQFKENLNTPDSIVARNLVWVPFDESTMGAQAGCGLGFAGVGIAIGLAASPTGGDAGGVAGGIAIFLGGTIAAMGLPEGIYLGGKWMGGNGSWWATLGGCLVGGLVGLVPNIFIKYGDFGVTAVVFAVGALSGGIAGYHLSASPIEREDHAGTTSLRRSPFVDKGMSPQEPRGIRQSVQITIVSIRL